MASSCSIAAARPPPPSQEPLQQILAATIIGTTNGEEEKIVMTNEDIIDRLAVTSIHNNNITSNTMNASTTASVGTTARRGRGSSEEIRSRLLTRLGIYGPNGNGTGGSTSSVGSSKMMMAAQPMTAAQHRRVRISRGMGVGYTMFHQSPPDGSATRKPLSGIIPSKEPLKSGIYSEDDYDDESIIVDDDENEDEDDDVDEDGEGSNVNTTRRRRKTTRTGVRTDPTDVCNTTHNNNNNNAITKAKTKTKTKTTRIAFLDQVEVMPIPTRHEYSNRIKSRIWSNRYELQENAERNAVEFAAEGWNWANVIEDEGMYICSVSGELVHPAWVGELPAAEKGPPVAALDVDNGNNSKSADSS